MKKIGNHNIPQRWEEVPYGRFFKIANLTGDINNTDKFIECIAILAGVDDILMLPYIDYMEISGVVAQFISNEPIPVFRKEVKIGRKKYVARSIEELTTKEFTDLDTLAQDGVRENGALLLGIMYKGPEDDKMEYTDAVRAKAEIFVENMSCVEGLGAIDFFLKAWLRYERDIIRSSSAFSQAMENPEMMKAMMQLDSLVGGGSSLCTPSAETTEG